MEQMSPALRQTLANQGVSANNVSNNTNQAVVQQQIPQTNPVLPGQPTQDTFQKIDVAGADVKNVSKKKKAGIV